jgi:hypothetical protein
VTLEEWLMKTGALAVAELAEGMPGSPHGQKKSAMIAWILEDDVARARAVEAKDLNERLEGSLNGVGAVGFVNRAGDAL